MLDSLRGVWDEEAVDELDHALQAAAQAIQDGADDELVLAAALHDIGHSPLLGGPHGDDHDRAGRAMDHTAFGARVGWLAGAHVAAKRYLAATDPQLRVGSESDVRWTSLRRPGRRGRRPGIRRHPGGRTRCGSGATTTRPRIPTPSAAASTWFSTSAARLVAMSLRPEAVSGPHRARSDPRRPARGRHLPARTRASDAVRRRARDRASGAARAACRGPHRAARPRHRGLAAQAGPAAVAEVVHRGCAAHGADPGPPSGGVGDHHRRRRNRRRA